MNITELARLLRVTPQELHDKLPLMGFDIGQKAIKVDNRTANQILKMWPSFIRRLQQAEERQKAEAAIKNMDPSLRPEVAVPAFVTVKNFAALSNLPINKILGELMKNGIFTSLNEKIDFETAMIIGADLGVTVILAPAEAESADQVNKVRDVLAGQEKAQMIQRPPVVVVMGHVDHGKTKLLDAIRSTDVVAREAGGITQSIGAYQIKKNDRLITFVDTPGHEAFTAMRNRGTKVADIAILVVAADDGVKPQTTEAYRIIEAAHLPFIVAINKIDKPDANIEKTKQELASQLNILVEEWGGKIVACPISAKTGTGIEELLNILLLTADMEAENLKANPDAPAVGTIIDSRLDKGEGPVATVLIQNGTLHVGDAVCFNHVHCGKVRSLKDHAGKNVLQALPSMPVKIIGLKVAPQVGDILEVGEGEKIKLTKLRANGVEQVAKITEEEVDNPNAPKINLIIKADTLGSCEAIESSISKLDTQGVRVKIIAKGLGNIIESDVLRAESAGAKILGFTVKAPGNLLQLAQSKNVPIKLYKIIYELINQVKADIAELVKPEIVQEEAGKLKVLAIFRTEHKAQIVGGKVITGSAKKDSLVEIWRDGKFIDSGRMVSLQAGKQDVSEVSLGQECALKYEGQPVIVVGDELVLLQEIKIFKHKQ